MTLGLSLTTPPPTLSATQAVDLAQIHFGIRGDLTPLTSERDLNFRLTSHAASYVLKLANRAEPATVTLFQTLALLHLQASQLPVPRVIRTLSGEPQAATRHGILRLLSYLTGTPQHLTQRTPAQCAAMGAMAARLSLGLAGFSHPAANHVLQWDIKQASTLRPLLPFITPDLRQLATEVLNRFDRDIAAVLPLTALETRLLPDLAATRMLTTLAIASARAADCPDNAPYILRNVPAAAAGLTALANSPRIPLELP